MNREKLVFIVRNGEKIEAVYTGITCMRGKPYFLQVSDMTLITAEKSDYIILNQDQDLPVVICNLLNFVAVKLDGSVGWDFRGVKPYKEGYQAYIRVRGEKKHATKEILGTFSSAVLAALAHDMALEHRGALNGYNFVSRQERLQMAEILEVDQGALLSETAYQRLMACDKIVGVDLPSAAAVANIVFLDPQSLPMGLLDQLPEEADMEEDRQDSAEQSGIRTPSEADICASASASVAGTGAANGLHCLLDAAVNSQVRMQLTMGKQAAEKQQSVILQGRLGQGGEGSVWKAMQCPDALPGMSTCHAGEVFALKMGRLYAEPGHVTGTTQQYSQQQQQQEERQLRREYDYLQLGSCSHVVKSSGVGYLEGFQLAQQQSGQSHAKTAFKIPCLHLEFAPHGTLSDYINRVHNSRWNNQLGFTQQQTRRIMQQLAAGTFHLHQKCLMHRDLKGENILVFNPPFGAVQDPLLHPEKLQYKISDFGTAFLKQGLATAPETFVGTRGCYMAPEMAVMENAEVHMTYEAAIDIWALGMLFLHIRFGTIPFFDLQADALANSGGKDIYLDYLKSSSCAYNMTLDWVGGPLTDVERKWLGGCLSVDASKRWSIRRLLIHEYLYEG